MSAFSDLSFLDPLVDFGSWFQDPISPSITVSERTGGSPSPEMDTAEERRLRRKISNRESARRSRARKQRHLQELRTRVEKLGSDNLELTARVQAVAGRASLFRLHNARLSAEAVVLRRRLAAARRALAIRQLLAGGILGFEQTILASLIA